MKLINKTLLQVNTFVHPGASRPLGRKAQPLTPNVWAAHIAFLPKKTVWEGERKSNALWGSLINLTSARWPRLPVISYVSYDVVKITLCLCSLHLINLLNPAKSQEKHQTNCNREHPKRRHDQYSWKLAMLSKRRKYWENATAKRMPRRHNSILNRILK